MNELQVLECRPIGIIKTPFDSPKGTPIQPPGGKDIEGKIEVFPEFQKGLKDIEGFSHLILLYHCHKAKPFSLLVKPFLDDALHGVFATRAPSRPNSIGLSIVSLIRVEGCDLFIKDVDIVNNTPLLDIKPYVPKFDMRQNVKSGWLESGAEKTEKTHDDGRFS